MYLLKDPKRRCRALALPALAVAITVALPGPLPGHAEDRSPGDGRASVAQVVEPNDLVFGLSDPDPAFSLELVRGPAGENGGTRVPDFWDEPFIQSVEFDNLDGIAHNPAGNLLGVDFGILAEGGSIYSLATTDSGLDQLIGNTTGLGGDGVARTRLCGLSVSPGNTKIAVIGYDTGKVIVYDYQAGNGNGEGASLSGAREADTSMCLTDVQGTTWKNDEVLLAFSSQGNIFEIHADTMNSTHMAWLEIIGDCGPGFTDIVYHQSGGRIYATYGTFTDTTRNLLFVLDEDYDLLGTFDYSVSMDTSREIAFDGAGNLYVCAFGGQIYVIPGASDLENLADNNSLDWYSSPSSASFSGIDVAVGTQDRPCPEDIDESGEVDFDDLLRVLATWGPCEECPEDIDENGDVDFDDLLLILSAWGPCEE